MEAGIRGARSLRRRGGALILGALLVGVLGGAVPSRAVGTGYIISGPGNASYPFPTVRAIAKKGSVVEFHNLDITAHNVYFPKLGVASSFLTAGGTQRLTNVTKKT